MAASGAPETMRAWQYSKYGGGASALVEVHDHPVPKPKKGELLIKVQAASVNPVDWKMQEGIMKPILPGKFPCVPGMDVAGTVVKAGAGVGTLSAGDRVVGSTSFMYGGAYAEYAIVASKAAAKLPEEVSMPDAAALPVAAITAVQGLRAGGVRDFNGSYNGNVLVLNASGGVGHYAVQLAKAAGAFVTASCGARNAGFVKGLGADEVIDYKTPEGEALASPSGRLYDIILDGTSGKSRDWGAVVSKLTQRGRFVPFTPAAGAGVLSLIQRLTFASKRIVTIFCVPNTEELDIVVGLLAAGKVKTVIDSSFPFEKAPSSWAKSIDGHAVGKIVVTME